MRQLTSARVGRFADATVNGVCLVSTTAGVLNNSNAFDNDFDNHYQTTADFYHSFIKK
ncbi:MULTISPECIES: hypothetical protein [Klebsiella]|uniref:hypothetical protein n=1 Tax=Klebsiella TaxID=570 RepID=UPI0012DC756A|nr:MULTISPECIES: hypothetical protein [Klebsiella]EKM7513620.1 hypothetical protein [Klebsiella aerogenes]EKV8806487.1 hypothetical protein [Klebsiella aerogenes]EKW8936078.1 hypothetical protein [Klebsiella aerogenes]EKZ9717768.1 hypothetical protein [Klebsiella aerogenes]ELJ2007228.1 hypothetical protein [Klebsiella aerogenes]